MLEPSYSPESKEKELLQKVELKQIEISLKSLVELLQIYPKINIKEEHTDAKLDLLSTLNTNYLLFLVRIFSFLIIKVRLLQPNTVQQILDQLVSQVQLKKIEKCVLKNFSKKVKFRQTKNYNAKLKLIIYAMHDS